jgi:hypothetical protein
MAAEKEAPIPITEGEETEGEEATELVVGAEEAKGEDEEEGEAQTRQRFWGEFQVIDAGTCFQMKEVPRAIRFLWARFLKEEYGVAYDDFWNECDYGMRDGNELNYSIWSWNWGENWYKLYDLNDWPGDNAAGAVYLKCGGVYHRVFSNGDSALSEYLSPGIQDEKLAKASLKRMRSFELFRQRRADLYEYRLGTHRSKHPGADKYSSEFRLREMGDFSWADAPEHVREAWAHVQFKGRGPPGGKEKGKLRLRGTVRYISWTWTWGGKDYRLQDLAGAVLLKNGPIPIWAYDIEGEEVRSHWHPEPRSELEAALTERCWFYAHLRAAVQNAANH